MIGKLWEENQNLRKKKMKNEDIDKPDIISAIKNDSNKLEWIIIGDKKKWKRSCPKCNKEIYYSGKRECIRAMKSNTSCNSCSGKMRCENRKSWVGENNPWYGKHRCGESNPFYKKTHSTKTKEMFAKNARTNRLGKKYSLETRIKMSIAATGIPKSPEHIRKIILNLKERAIKTLQVDGLLKIGYNPNACKYFDKLNEEMGWNLQHATNGGEKRVLCYFVDAYDKEKNIVVEYDEKYHYNVYGKLKEKDIIRMKDIINKLKCKFYRYNEETKVLSEMKTPDDVKISAIDVCDCH